MNTHALMKRTVRAAAAALLTATLLSGYTHAQGALTLGDAARMAAKQNTSLDIVRARVAQADARVVQQKASLYPDVSAHLQQAQRTTNTATFGFSFRDAATGNYLFDPHGQLLGPIPQTDARYRVSQTLFDAAAFARVKAARSASAATSADLNSVAEGAAAMAALAYIRVIRAEAQLSARSADSVLAADLERIARDQLAAGAGIALDGCDNRIRSVSYACPLGVAAGGRVGAQMLEHEIG